MMFCWSLPDSLRHVFTSRRKRIFHGTTKTLVTPYLSYQKHESRRSHPSLPTFRIRPPVIALFAAFRVWDRICSDATRKTSGRCQATFFTMKSFSFFLVLVVIASASAFSPSVQKRPSSRLFLCPEDAKDLEQVACIQYEYQHLIREATENTTYNNHDIVHRNGPMAWCRRILRNLTHKQVSLHP